MSKEETQEKDVFSKFENTSLGYVKREQFNLILSIIIPIFLIIVQIINLVLSLNIEIEELPPGQLPPPHGMRPSPGQMPLFDIITPAIIIFIFSAIAIWRFIIILNWRKTTDEYKKIKKSLKQEDLGNPDSNIPAKNVSLSQILYKITSDKEKTNKLFIIQNILVVLMTQWFVRYFLGFFSLLTIPDAPNLLDFGQIINIIAQIAIIVYLYLEWTHFLVERKKLKRLEEIEKLVFDEIGDIL